MTEFVDFFDADYRFDGGDNLKLAVYIANGTGYEYDFSNLLEL